MVVLTMKNMKEHEEAVAEFQSSVYSIVRKAIIPPFHLAYLTVWPKAKFLHDLHALHGNFCVSLIKPNFLIDNTLW